MTLKQFQNNLMFNSIIKALQISYSTCSVGEFEWLLKEIPVPPDNFNSDGQSTTQDDTQAVQDNLMLTYKIKHSKSQFSPLLSVILDSF